MGPIIPNMGTKKIKINISDALFSKVQQRVLGQFFSNPHKSFYLNEMVRVAHSGKGAVQRELKKLTLTGIILEKKIGNQKYYQVNFELPFFSELSGIINKTFGLAEVIKKAFSSEMKSKIEFSFIYGSIAKQEATASSDIDLMVITDSLTYADLFYFLEDAEKELGRKINPTIYGKEDFLKKYHTKNNFITQVIKLPKIFIIGNENEFKEFGKFS